jgi:hypothetical protein
MSLHKGKDDIVFEVKGKKFTIPFNDEKEENVELIDGKRVKVEPKEIDVKKDEVVVGLDKNGIIMKIIKTKHIIATIPLMGDSLWKKITGNVHITSIDFEGTEIGTGSGQFSVLMWVHHDYDWEIYTDNGFEKGISALVSEMVGTKVEISFTEQGMQKNKLASMEPVLGVSKTAISNWLKNP